MSLDKVLGAVKDGSCADWCVHKLRAVISALKDELKISREQEEVDREYAKSKENSDAEISALEDEIKVKRAKILATRAKMEKSKLDHAKDMEELRAKISAQRVVLGAKARALIAKQVEAESVL